MQQTLFETEQPIEPQQPALRQAFVVRSCHSKEEHWQQYDEWLTLQGHDFMRRQRTKKWWFENHNNEGRYIGGVTA